MKQNLRNLVAMSIAIIGCWSSNVQAQEDVTSTYLQNADLMSLDGWTFSSTKNNAGKNDYEAYKTDGDVPVVEFYHTWGGNAGAAIGTTYEFSATQTVTLPAGEYRIAVNAFYREGNGNGTNEKAYIFAGEEKQYIVGLTSAGVGAYTGSSDLYKAANAFSKGDFSNAFDFTVDTEKEIELGFKGYMDTYCSWCILGPVKLYKYSLEAYKAEYDAVKEQAEALYNSLMEATVLEALKAAVVDDSQFTSSSEYKQATAELQAAVANAETSIAVYNKLGAELSFVENFKLTLADDAEERVALDEAVALVKELYTEGLVSVDEVAKNIETLNERLRIAVKAQTADNSDMTPAIINNSFETGNTDGWTVINSSDTGVRTNTGDYVTEGIDGDYLFNTWWQGTPITQTIADLPNGKYRMDVLVSSDGATIYLLANGEHNEGVETGGSYPSSNVFQDVSFEFEVTDGTATIGVIGGAAGTAGEHKEYVEGGYWWYKADNFRLTLLETAAPETVYDLVPTEVTPAPETVIEELAEIVFTFPEKIADIVYDKLEECTLRNLITGEEYYLAPNTSFADLHQIGFFAFNESFLPITETGTYVLTVPAGIFGDADYINGNGGHGNSKLTYTFYVEAPAEPVTATILPAEGEVTSLEQFVIDFDRDVNVNWNCSETIDLLDSEGDVVASATGDDCDLDWDNYCRVTVKLNTSVVLPGAYTLVIPAERFELGEQGNVYNDRMVYSYVIISGGGSGIDAILAGNTVADVYTINGVLVLKNADREALKTLKKGVYVINGKKVIMK